MRFFACFIVSLSLLACVEAQSWTVTTRSDPETVGPGVAYVRKTLEKNTDEGKTRTTLHLVHFDADRVTLKVVDQGDTKPGKYENLADAMRRNFCVAGCNGGFFHPDYRPAGLVIADGDRFNTFEQAKLLSGVIVVDDRGPRLLRRAEFTDHPDVAQLLQSGPFLVDRGKTVAGLSATSPRPRTFIMTDGAGRWAIGLCTGITLADLGAVLADPAIVTEMKPSRALNLDGGSSSSLYFDRGAGNKPFHHQGFATVRNFIGIAPAAPRR